LFFEHSLTFWKKNCLVYLRIYISAPHLLSGISSFSKELWFLLVMKDV
jgi:hypothetical protein